MKFQFKTKLLSKGIVFRFLAILTFAIGIIAVLTWQFHTETISHFLVHVPNELKSYEPAQKLTNNSENNSCFIEGEHNATELHNAILRNVTLNENDLKNAHITNSDFTATNLNKTDFSNATVFYSNFSKGNLSNANLTNARFHGSDLTGVKLNSAIMIRANLTHSDLNYSNLSNANLKDTNFSDARLEKAVGLTYKQLEEAVINEFTTLPPHLEKQREKLLKHSHIRLEKLKTEMSKDEFERYFIEFK